jgi:hypothetical protein
MLTLSRQRIELSAGDSVELIVELDAGDQPTDGSSVQWESSDPAVAIVSRDGVVTAAGPGLAEVTCLWRGRRAVCLVHVSAATPLPAPEPSAAPETGRVAVKRSRWWIGAAAVAVVAAALFARSRGVGTGPAVAPNASAPAPTTPARSTPGSATSTPEPARAEPPAAPAPPAATTTRSPAQTATARGRDASASGRSAGIEPRVTSATSQEKATPLSTPPAVPPVRAESARLTTRIDTGSGYGPPRSTSPAAPPAPAPSASARDSAADRIPPAPREIAVALFKEFANAINAQSFSRITGAYTQPNDPAAVRLWQEFLIFVRDYTPRASVRSTTVNETTYPPTITATIDFRWASDQGFDRVRSGSFTGVGVPIPNGWQLHRVQLAKRFW